MEILGVAFFSMGALVLSGIAIYGMYQIGGLIGVIATISAILMIIGILLANIRD